MRKVTASRSYLSALHEQLAFGEMRFGAKVVAEPRIHLIIHRRADRSNVDIDRIEWR